MTGRRIPGLHSFILFTGSRDLNASFCFCVWEFYFFYRCSASIGSWVTAANLESFSCVHFVQSSREDSCLVCLGGCSVSSLFGCLLPCDRWKRGYGFEREEGDPMIGGFTEFFARDFF